MKQIEIVISGITKENRIDKYNSLVSAIDSIASNNIDHIKQDIKKSGEIKRDYRDISILLPYPLEKSSKKAKQALRSASFALDIPVKAVKGEVFMFTAQEDLTDKWAKEMARLVRDTYNFTLSYFGLPSANVIQKSRNLIHMGKVLYYPDTGQPIKKKDWDLFVSNLEKFLNRRIKNHGEKIVLEAQTLGKILNRMLKYNTLDVIKDRRLSEVKLKNKSFDWISSNTKNMKNVFGESLTRAEQSRIQVMSQSAGARLTRATDAMKNDVKQVLIDGIKQRKSKTEVSQELFRKMVGQNRDFQRIADTEIQNAVNNAYLKEEVYNAGEGEKVYFQRAEVIDGNTCDFCKKMNGKIVLWSDTPLSSDKIKDEYADIAIWDGKEWTGEKNVVTTGGFHPWCRGAWVRWSPQDRMLDALMADKSGKKSEWNKIIKESRKLNKSLTWSGYKLQGRAKFHGLDLSIENKKGSTRSGIDKDGKPWKIKMLYDYGYIRGTVGVDGDHIDCYIGDYEDAKSVYVIHQKIPNTQEYDEDKVMLNFRNAEQAKKAYLAQYNRPGFFMSMDVVPLEVFLEQIKLKKYRNKKLEINS